MIKFPSKTRYVSLAAALIAVVALRSHAGGSPTIFTIDTSQSVLQLSGLDSNGDPLSPQANGRFTAYPSGSVVANIAGGLIDFPGGSASALDAGPGPFLPLSLPANFAGQAGPGPDAVFAVRNLVTDIVAGPTPIDLVGNFSAAAALPILAGTFDYDLGFTSGSVDLTVSPGSTTNAPAASGSLQQIGNLLVLTIPIDTSSTFLVNNVPVGTAHYVGLTVATAVIPEPSSAVLAAGSLAGFFIWTRLRIAGRRCRRDMPR